ncbi:hypothetical protein R69746_03074 [Paraburkholderia aspalathi]|uniref:hypothetical protein n=1 Tax=Paraburkholderia aspalathi TaxID=1324617 RepID=UPI0006B40E6D|nr:hypothetical protein [Paraburkholderia aspalathi]KPD15451.1 hypothetical protein ADM96_32795 [Burkholderia sp. ST111]MBK3836937.1 hypothetical protein [Paraburkholderia aspalathi]CAE6753714.1 hypothetical protein R69746_03074 [Paraburkholderia aspalathi]
MHHATIIFNSSFDAAERCAGDIIQARVGGPLYIVESRRSSAPLGSNAIRVRQDKLEDLYCRIASTQGACTVQVLADCSEPVLDFMKEYPGTAGDFGVAVMSTTRDKESQEKLIDTFEEMVHLGMERAQVRFLFVQAPRDQPLESEYPTLMGYLKSSCAQPVVSPAVLYESVAFSKIREHQLAVAPMLSGETNFQTMLEAARQRGDNEVALRNLSQKLLAQRALHACRNDIEKAVAALQLPGDTALRQPQPGAHLPAPEENSVAPGAADATPGTMCAAVDGTELDG